MDACHMKNKLNKQIPKQRHHDIMSKYDIFNSNDYFQLIKGKRKNMILRLFMIFFRGKAFYKDPIH